ncbi:lysophospholipase [Patescibacteria group bacterium]|nr:lysophospholipase [Patescibacteria group bacterium]MBU1721960.1 lysophospholipase [Patescibacteria group bacterium]MBU1901781.1 lysophospholipase [Patescibacteria group bacterium]
MDYEKLEYNGTRFYKKKGKYDNLDHLKDYDGQLFIIHGSFDRMILPEVSRNLFDALDLEDKKYLLIEGAGHDNLWSFSDFIRTLGDVL